MSARCISDLEVRQGWLGRRGRDDAADPPMDHPDSFGYGASALDDRVEGADRDGTGASR